MFDKFLDYINMPNVNLSIMYGKTSPKTNYQKLRTLKKLKYHRREGLKTLKKIYTQKALKFSRFEKNKKICFIKCRTRSSKLRNSSRHQIMPLSKNKKTPLKTKTFDKKTLRPRFLECLSVMFNRPGVAGAVL